MNKIRMECRNFEECGNVVARPWWCISPVCFDCNKKRKNNKSKEYFKTNRKAIKAKNIRKKLSL